MKKEKSISKVVSYIEFICFSLSIVLQNFALVRTDRFGIAASTCVLVYFFIRHRLFRFLNMKVFSFLCLVIVFLVFNGIINSSFNVMQILRILMIIFDIWVTFVYVKSLSAADKNSFIKIFAFCYIAMCLYGLYEYYAQSHGLPRYLNYLSNNPSYGVRSPYSVNEGWSNSARVFTCFFEPSVFSVFLVYGYVLIMKNIKNSVKRNKLLSIIISVLFITVLFLSSARTGFLYLVYIIIALLLSRVIKVNSKAMLVSKCLFVLLPVLTLVGSYSVGLIAFGDLSIEGRTSSSLYYAKASFDSPYSILFGHGFGSMVAEKEGIFIDGVRIENHAHNGYIEILYQYGIIALCVLIYYVVRIIENVPDKDKLLLYAIVFSLACTGELYTVETLAITTSLIYSFSCTSVIKKSKKLAS